MHFILKFRTLLVLFALATMLSACDSMKVWREAKPEPCPRVTVLGDASDLTRFKPGRGQDLIDVLFEARIANVYSVCKYDVDYDTRVGEINVQLAAEIAAKRGPANTDRSAELEYFVVVLDGRRNILDKNNFSLKLGFPGNLTQNMVRDEIIDLVLNTDGSTDGADYEVIVGIQLTKSEIEYNRKLRLRR